MTVATVALWTANVIVSPTCPILDRHPALVSRVHHGCPFRLDAAMCAAAFGQVAWAVPETCRRVLEDIERGWFTAAGHLEQTEPHP